MLKSFFISGSYFLPALMFFPMVAGQDGTTHICILFPVNLVMCPLKFKLNFILFIAVFLICNSMHLILNSS